MIREQLNALLSATKNEIVHLLTEKYLADNDGLYPKWDEDEEIVVDDTDFPTFRISVDVDNTYDESTCIERQAINEYRVTNDGNLFFVCGDYDNEIEWTEVATDELVAIYYNLLKGFTPTPMKGLSKTDNPFFLYPNFYLNLCNIEFFFNFPNKNNFFSSFFTYLLHISK